MQGNRLESAVQHEKLCDKRGRPEQQKTRNWCAHVRKTPSSSPLPLISARTQSTGLLSSYSACAFEKTYCALISSRASCLVQKHPSGPREREREYECETNLKKLITRHAAPHAATPLRLRLRLESSALCSTLASVSVARIAATVTATAT